MEQYEVFYRDDFLGILTVDPDTGYHAYAPNPAAVSKLKARVPLFPEIEAGTNGFVPPIPFFQNRLMNMNRWGLDEINYQTDCFLIRRCKKMA